MELPPKRKGVNRRTVRNAWQANFQWVKEYGFSEYSLEAIADDHEDIRICWCCGRMGYQEVAHIIPHSLGGTHLPNNCFLLCAECHLTSPDCSRPKYFVAFINRNAGRCNQVFCETFKMVSERIKEFCEREPENAEAALEYLKDYEDFDFGSHMTTHGSSFSLSTKMACIEMIVDDAIDLARRKSSSG
ncbi:HNH endonuclease signature motif containing protein [Pseudomonas syringae]|uniref:HNH endonuclease n=1 Tax=Pseudomonas syringae pv. syringae TaxID=321 RepID=A0AAE5VVU1_PSESY|nr:HNH endonuclease signature motif containing protein [Pseudomonas syringae]PHN79907.1 hypothetical protein AO071_05055 [Pseudomonas syringae]POQ05537.1 HNH endonuclease [Pseudomonas syringae pv. syringae]